MVVAAGYLTARLISSNDLHVTPGYLLAVLIQAAVRVVAVDPGYTDTLVNGASLNGLEQTTIASRFDANQATRHADRKGVIPTAIVKLKAPNGNETKT